MVKMVDDFDDFKKQMKNAGDKVVVVDFTATWCSPCKMIAPIFEELAEKYTNMVFLKVDMDEAEDVGEEYNVTSMPTFIFIKNTKELERFCGANGDKLKAKVEEFSKQ
ncbi:thioredoxin-like [Solea solea]|uniref:thioredoxin-like n=1 Tax=Solea solea TaxID=90069 RepID=UPI0027297EC7|nr:thioredoxin-like [Solea solea]